MDVSSDLPYYAEYARSSRASCKGCKKCINQGELRLAAMVQSAFHDGRQPQWYHEKCFFKKLRPEAVGDFGNYENLRFEDQQMIEKEIANARKPTKKNKLQASKDFAIEYAKSGRAVCRGCELKIQKDQVRIRKTVYDTEVGMKYGGQALWHHAECFAQIRDELGWQDAGEQLPGFASLKAADQSNVKQLLPAANGAAPSAAKKPKLEKFDKTDEQAEKAQKKLLKTQSERLFKFRDCIRAEMKRADIVELLEYNDQQAVQGDTEKLHDQAADMLAFGALAPCTQCASTELLFTKAGYVCQGNLTEWTKCNKVETAPKRRPCDVSSELKHSYSFLKKACKKPEQRVIQYTAPSTSTILKNVAIKKAPDDTDGPKVKREKPPLYEWTFCYVGPKNRDAELKERLAKLGAKLNTRITDNTIAVISSEKEVARLGSQMSKASELCLPVVPIEYIDAVESGGADVAIKNITSMSLCGWGKAPDLDKVGKSAYKSGSLYTKSVPKSVTLKLKNGLAVDPASGLDDIAHVYVNKSDKYNVVLGLTDVQKNKNSYYKLQLLESDSKNKYWVFRSWGRIGTTIGDNKLEKFGTLYEAIDSFKEVYLQKTGNDFENRANFVKLPNRMYEIDIDYTEKRNADFTAAGLPESKLHVAVQDLIKLLFDVDSMKRAMLEFQLDLEKMPLGKISLKQINLAYKVLTEIQKLHDDAAAKNKTISTNSIFDATNRFYTLIPHNFGVNKPPLIEQPEQIQKLCEMLDSLTQIECAYNFIQSDANQTQHPIDLHYEQLKTNIEPLDSKCEEYELIAKYVRNTHAETHQTYELVIKEIFKVSRQGESRRYKPFKKLHNRKLLWHGSRLTNYVGILSHGLKIAPPEAPVTGYMFGKGIYFADMVSKSANYCFTSQANSTGLLLLSEVALGDTLDCTQAKYVTQLPKGKHSCFGVGRTAPDPSESHTRVDGVEIPLGRPLTKAELKTSLLYNEFIVYDIAQVNIQYMLVMDFKFKY